MRILVLEDNNERIHIFSKLLAQHNCHFFKDVKPAIEYISGDKYWYYNGEEINCNSNEECLRIIKLLLFR